MHAHSLNECCSCGLLTLLGWSGCPDEVRETLPQQFPLPGGAHQTRVSGLAVQIHIMGAETDSERGVWSAHLWTGQTRWGKTLAGCERIIIYSYFQTGSYFPSLCQYDNWLCTKICHWLHCRAYTLCSDTHCLLNSCENNQNYPFKASSPVASSFIIAIFNIIDFIWLCLRSNSSQ